MFSINFKYVSKPNVIKIFNARHTFTRHLILYTLVSNYPKSNPLLCLEGAGGSRRAVGCDASNGPHFFHVFFLLFFLKRIVLTVGFDPTTSAIF